MTNLCPDCKMTVREQWIQKYLKGGISIPELAKIAGVHENTLYNWKEKYLSSGLVGLKDESRAPRSHPNEYSEEVKQLIRTMRANGLEHEKRYLGPKVIAHRLEKYYDIKAAPSGIGKFLNHNGLIPERHIRRRPKKERVKQCRIYEPGELMQMDVKYAVKSYAGHWFYEFDAIDYVTGVVYGEIYEIQSNLESTLFLKSLQRKTPFRLRGVQTDNGSIFTNYYTGYKKSADPMKPRLHCFDLTCQVLEITHYLIDPGKPAQNGKIERFHKTAEENFYQMETFKDLNSLRKKFRDFLYYYNNEREHQSLDLLTPLEKLKTFAGYEKIQEILN